MALASKQDHHRLVEKSIGSVRMKMNKIKTDIKTADERRNRADKATEHHLRRERKALDSQRDLYDKIQQREALIEKGEIKLGYLKERRYLAEWRKNEGDSMRRYLEKNQVDFTSDEVKIVSFKGRAQEMVAKIATKNKCIIAKEKDIAFAEEREYKARDKIALLNEKLIAAEHESRRITINYTPRTVAEYDKEILFLKQNIGDFVDRIRRRQENLENLEKRAAELQRSVDTLKQRKRELEQTLHELRGARI